MGDDLLDDAVAEHLATMTQADVRGICDAMSEWAGDWQGIPVPLGEDMPLVLAKDHPLAAVYNRPVKRTCGTDDVVEDERIVNSWFSRKRNCEVYVVESAGVYSAVTLPRSPDRSMDRLTLWLQTMGAADAWELDAEHKARETLRAMLSERQWMHYDLTGSFFETSPRSRLTYVFRRLRPTLALTPRGKNGREGTMLCLAVLCMHPIGYYSRSWAGCMVPSDDVIAHLAWMRGDEAGFWRQANQHDPASPEAGL